MARIATRETIGRRLEAARERSGFTVPEVMAAIGGRALPTWYRWINGEQEGGCRDVTAAGLFLGLRPDELMLEENEPAPDKPQPFNARDKAGLEEIRARLAELTEVCEGLPRRPVDVVVDLLRSACEAIPREKRHGGLPAGTTIKHAEGMKLYEPPPRSKRRRKSGPDDAIKAGEAPAPYGAPRKKPQK